MSERRYSEEEVAQIFERATEAQKVAVRPSSPAEGLTLVELQDIGRDVGLAPELVSKAARSLDATTSVQPAPRLLGLPVRVAHTIQLPRRLSDEEWERLVLDLRTTFDAAGKLRDDGGFKQWTNGRLEVLLEPTPEGQQLRFRTFSENGVGMLVGGGITLAIALIALGGTLLGGGEIAGRLPGFTLLFALGFGFTGTALARVPGWARLRRSQFEQIAEKVASALRNSSEGGDVGRALPPGDTV